MLTLRSGSLPRQIAPPYLLLSGTFSGTLRFTSGCSVLLPPLPAYRLSWGKRKPAHLLRTGVAGCATGSTRPLGAHPMPDEYLSLYHIKSRSSCCSMRIMGWRRRQRICHVAISLHNFEAFLYAEWHMPSAYSKWARCDPHIQHIEAAAASNYRRTPHLPTGPRV
jgi:hypothetical protein